MRMMKNGSWRGRRLLPFLLCASGIAILSFFLFLGPQHNHSDFQSHNDCPACQWQASNSFLFHEEIILLCISAIAFLRQFRPQSPVLARKPRPFSIRAPPHSIA